MTSRRNLPAIASILTDVAAASGGSWEGGPLAAQQAMLDVAGPSRVRHVPITGAGMTQALDALGAGALPGIAIRVRRSEAGWTVTVTDPARRPEAVVLHAIVAPDGAVLAVCRCSRCGALVTHGLGDNLDEADQLLGHRVAHCACNGGGYTVRDPDGVLARLRADLNRTPDASASTR
jgi:hypothetical protein